MRARKPAWVGIGILSLLLLVGGGTAVAADHALLVGRLNTADATTSLSNSAGTALALTSKSGTPPLRVSGRAKVPNFNADFVDGLSSGDFALRAGRAGVVVGSENDADGYVNTARCPKGSIATGGGGYASGTRDYLYYSGPDFTAGGSLIPNSWFAVADGDAVAWVMCYNPRGAVPGATTTWPSLNARGAAASVQKLPGQHASQKGMP